ncbi:hypothetical protein LSAT2_018816 [Lamellibrachia satsuma]|nr:hypothetical protein LSAT2_018816 [Lamellibrachia satsuma]
MLAYARVHFHCVDIQHEPGHDILLVVDARRYCSLHLHVYTFTVWTFSMNWAMISCLILGCVVVASLAETWNYDYKQVKKPFDVNGCVYLCQKTFEEAQSNITVPPLHTNMTQGYGSRVSVLPQIGENTVSDEVGNSRQPDDRGMEFTGESEATSSAAEVRLGSPGSVQPEGECPHLRNT